MTSNANNQKEGNIIYNVTLHIDHSIHSAWLQWMIEKHIVHVMASGCFTEYRMLRLLQTDESTGITYAMQYTAQNMELYNRYINDFAPAMRQEVTDTWGALVAAFRTVMQVVH